MAGKNIIFLHVAFWLFILSQRVINFASGSLKVLFPDTYIAGLILFILWFYFIYGLAIPAIRDLKKKPLWIVFLLILLCAYNLDQGYIFTKYFELEYRFDFWLNDLRPVISSTVYALFMRFSVDWFVNRKQKDDLIMKKQAGELALLKSQINPHFLFNTLNNIHSLVYRQSPEAPSAVRKLSDILRYTIYDSNTDLVPLEKEINFIRSYIELQELRFSSNNVVKFSSEIIDAGLFIPPMLFIPFIENAFKHCRISNQEPCIAIAVFADRSQITLDVFNHKLRPEESIKDESGGIGLANVKRRLEILYPGKHKLHILDDNLQFTIKLELRNK